jgi:hypothetical protein
MPRPYKERPAYREVSHQTKLRYLRAYNRMQRGLKYVRAFFSGDPWALLTLLRVRNWSPVHHEPDLRHPVTLFYGDEPYPAYIVGGYEGAPTPKRKVIPDHEPLGPEDYELGLKVEPAEADMALVQAFLDNLPPGERPLPK